MGLIRMWHRLMKVVKKKTKSLSIKNLALFWNRIYENYFFIDCAFNSHISSPKREVQSTFETKRKQKRMF